MKIGKVNLPDISAGRRVDVGVIQLDCQPTRNKFQTSPTTSQTETINFFRVGIGIVFH